MTFDHYRLSKARATLSALIRAGVIAPTDQHDLAEQIGTYLIENPDVLADSFLLFQYLEEHDPVMHQQTCTLVCEQAEGLAVEYRKKLGDLERKEYAEMGIQSQDTATSGTTEHVNYFALNAVDANAQSVDAVKAAFRQSQVKSAVVATSSGVVGWVQTSKNAKEIRAMLAAAFPHDRIEFTYGGDWPESMWKKYAQQQR